MDRKQKLEDLSRLTLANTLSSLGLNEIDLRVDVGIRREFLKANDKLLGLDMTDEQLELLVVVARAQFDLMMKHRDLASTLAGIYAAAAQAAVDWIIDRE